MCNSTIRQPEEAQTPRRRILRIRPLYSEKGAKMIKKEAGFQAMDLIFIPSNYIDTLPILSEKKTN